MNSHQDRVGQSFRRVEGWFVTNPQYTAKDGPASTPALATQLDALHGIVSRVTDYAAMQVTQAAQSLLISKDEREQRKEILTHHMATIAKVARALRGQVPGIGILTTPKGTIQSAALVNSATGMARKAEIYQSVLVEHGLPSDFVQQLSDASEALKGSLDARGEARAARAGATKGIESELALGRRVIEVMDATLSRLLRSNPAKLAEWKHVKRVTVRGAVPRTPVASIQTSPIGIQPSQQSVETSPQSVQGSQHVVQSSPTALESAPTTEQKAA